jgi:phage terminase large subunit-like protein
VAVAFVGLTHDDFAAEIERREAARVLRTEIERREAARSSLGAWFEFGPPTEKGAPLLDRWQRDLLSRVQALASDFASVPGDEARPVWIVNVDAPPQSGKSEAVKRALAWLMATYGWSCGYASYGASLAVAHSVQVRALMRSSEARSVWPWLDGRSGRGDDVIKDTEDEWSIAAPTPGRRGARFVARGRDGALTGRTMDVIALDDLYKDAGDYGSTASRREVDGFLRSAASARLLERGGIILNVGTRWGLHDARGWFDERVEEMRAAGARVRVETWSYPLRAGPGDVMGRAAGEYLTDRWDEAKEAAARVLYGRHAAAILDGRPGPEGGAFFRREWFDRRYTGHPDVVARHCDFRLLAVDPASSEGTGDHSVIQHWGWQGARMLLLGQWRGQWGYASLRQALLDAIGSAKPHAVAVEATSNGRAVLDELRRSFPNVEPMGTQSKGKSVRWDAQAPVFHAGNVWFPEAAHAPWMLGLVDRLCLVSGHGDEVDDEADAWEIAARYRAERGIVGPRAADTLRRLAFG